MDKGINVLSLFDGISCGMVALERAGIKVNKYDAYEIEQNAIIISKKNYPEIRHHGDVTIANFEKYENYDLLIGGSPCTNWSCSKNHMAKVKKEKYINEGIGWELFKQYVRALEESKPKFFLYENNYRMPKNIMDNITLELGVDPIMINSSLVSAQRRKRLYWVGYRNKNGNYNTLKIEQPKDRGVLLKDIYVPDDKLIKVDSRIPLTAIKTANYIKYDLLNKGHYSQAYRLYYLDGKAPTIPRCRTETKCNILIDKTDVSKYKLLSPLEAERLQTLPDNYTKGVPKTRRFEAIGNGWTVDVIAHILSFMSLNKEQNKGKAKSLVKHF